MKNRCSGFPCVYQSGAVLIVALIILLLLSIIGVSGMRGVGLQENMAGNLRDGNLALQASEAALREGENYVSDTPFDEMYASIEAGPVSGIYKGFPGVSESPVYTVTLLSVIVTSTELTEYNPEGALVKVESTGYGLSSNANDTPSAKVKLQATFMVRK